ncbi:MAG: carbon-nitrogen hydrolase family protein [Burkholderiales bacterium]|nr:carbon-nitrogen hydrolase family protein [Burkholderiales bacterium]
MQKNRVRVAIAQLHVEPWAEERNLKKVCDYMRRAARAGAKVAVFSEGMSNGYVFQDIREAEAAATTIPGPFIDPVRALAQELNVWVAIGLLERAPQGIYNNALLISPDGNIHSRYRKTFFIRSDKIWMRHGGVCFDAVVTPFGKVGLVICADMRIPEPARCTALSGAQVLFNVSNWGGPDQYEIHAPARALENHCWVISADKVGSEPGIRYPGHSQVVNPDGRIIAEASEFDEELLVVDIDPTEADHVEGRKRFADRRPDLYRMLCDPQAGRPLFEDDASRITGCYVAACQVVSARVEEALRVCEEACRLDEAQLLVLPELFTVENPEDDSELRQRSEQSARLIEPFVNFSRSTCSVLVIGLPQKSANGMGVANSACVIDRGKMLGSYQKTHLHARESDRFIRGNDLPVFETSIGRIGVLLGNEGVVTEIPRVLALKGAEILAWPTRWTGQRASELLPLERALENQVYIVVASPAEHGTGHSQVVSPRTYPVPALRSALGAGRVGFVGQLIVPMTARVKMLSRNTDVFAHRMPDAYSILAASQDERRIETATVAARECTS